MKIEDCSPELYFLKFTGIPAPWQCVNDARRIGFKCIKYASWHVVHIDETSPGQLREIGSSLVDRAHFPLERYAHFACIWERVRRWAKDKENLSAAPELTPEFDVLQRELRFGSSDFNYAAAYVADSLGRIAREPDVVWLLFKSTVARKMLAHSRAIAALSPGIPVFSAQQSAFDTATALDTALVGIYAQLGIAVSSAQPGSLLDRLLADLGLHVVCPAASAAREQRHALLPRVAVEKCERPDLRLVEFAMVQGSMVVKVNSKHPALEQSFDLASTFSNPNFWTTFGLGCADQLGSLEELQSFADSWGVHLAAVARRGRRVLHG